MSEQRSRFTREKWIDIGIQVGALALAMVFTTIILLAAGAPPLAAYKEIITGAFGSVTGFSNVLVAWVPLLLAASGVLVTFAAGLWNIGVEGQIVFGAVLTTWVLRLLQDTSLSPAVIIIVAIARRHGRGRPVGRPRRGPQDLRGSERDLRRAGPELRRRRADALADLRSVEAPGHRLDERHRAVPGPGWPCRRSPACA